MCSLKMHCGMCPLTMHCGMCSLTMHCGMCSLTMHCGMCSLTMHCGMYSLTMHCGIYSLTMHSGMYSLTRHQTDRQAFCTKVLQIHAMHRACVTYICATTCDLCNTNYKTAGPIGRAVWGLSPAVIVGSNPTGGHGCLSVVGAVFYQVEVSMTSRSLVQRSPTDCGVSLCAI